MEPFATPGSYISSSTCGFLWEVELFCFDSFSFCLIEFLIILIFVFWFFFLEKNIETDRRETKHEFEWVGRKVGKIGRNCGRENRIKNRLYEKFK